MGLLNIQVDQCYTLPDHDRVVDQVLRSPIHLPIYRDLHGAEGEVLLQGETSGGDDEVSLDILPVVHLNSGLCESVNMSGDYSCLAVPGKMVLIDIVFDSLHLIGLKKSPPGARQNLCSQGL